MQRIQKKANIGVLGLLSCGHSVVSILSAFVVISVTGVFTYEHRTHSLVLCLQCALSAVQLGSYSFEISNKCNTQS